MEMICKICGKEVKQVSSATPELAMFQHLLWIHGIIDQKQSHWSYGSGPGTLAGDDDL